MSIENTFAKFQRLPARVAVYVPSTDGINTENAALAEQMKKEVAARLSDLFGGATCSGASGYWNSAEIGLVVEYVNIVYSNTTPEMLDRHAAEILEIAEHVKSAMGQEAVSVEINGNLYLI